MVPDAGFPNNDAVPAAKKCAKHGLNFNPELFDGCILCRKEQAAAKAQARNPPPSPAGRRPPGAPAGPAPPAGLRPGPKPPLARPAVPGLRPPAQGQRPPASPIPVSPAQRPPGAQRPGTVAPRQPPPVPIPISGLSPPAGPPERPREATIGLAPLPPDEVEAQARARAWAAREQAAVEQAALEHGEEPSAEISEVFRQAPAPLPPLPEIRAGLAETGLPGLTRLGTLKQGLSVSAVLVLLTSMLFFGVHSLVGQAINGMFLFAGSGTSSPSLFTDPLMTDPMSPGARGDDELMEELFGEEGLLNGGTDEFIGAYSDDDLGDYSAEDYDYSGEGY